MNLLYIDPGTGSMLFSLLIGLAAAGIYMIRGLAIRLKFRLSGGKAEAKDKAGHSLVIYAESKRYWNVFGPICDELESRKVSAEYYTSSEDDPAFEQEYKYVHPVFIGTGNKAFARLNLLNADIVLSTTPGLNVLQWKRSKGTKYYVHILHAVGSAAGYRMFGLDYYDSVLLSGQFQADEIRELERLRGLPEKEICFVGQPYLDRLYDRRLSCDANDKEKPGKRHSDNYHVLLAPSWGPSSILCKFGEEMIQALIQTGYDITIRPHPQSYTADKAILDELIRNYPESEHLHWNRDNDNFDVLYHSDIMITDFSGVIHDFALVFDKPFIYADTSFDHAPYDSAWIEEPLWKFRIIPEMGKKLEAADFGNMKAVIDEVIMNDQYMNGRAKAREEAWMYRGEAAKKTVDYLLKKQEELMPT